MARAEVLPLHESDVEAVAAIVRQADRDEIEEALQVPIAQAIRDGLGGHKASKIVVDGEVVAVFGDAPHSEGIGVPWLISTVHVERRPRAFLEVCRPEVAEMLTRSPLLTNFVDARNTVAIRWLQWLGFTFEPPAPYGPLGLPFRQFWMRGAHVHQ